MVLIWATCTTVKVVVVADSQGRIGIQATIAERMSPAVESSVSAAYGTASPPHEK